MTQYKLTTVTDIYNTGVNTEVNVFDTFNELQDFITDKTSDMTIDESELFNYNSSINEIE